MNNILCLVLFLSAALQFASSQVSIGIMSLPESTPLNAEFYLAGNINNWNPGDSLFKFEKNDEGCLWLGLPVGDGVVEFKITRGDWEKVEGAEYGAFIPNRAFTYGKADTLYLDILSWEDLDGDGRETISTANAQVQIWNDAMYMPQLDRERRVWVYLPQGYNQSEQYYRVLYMHDGQNVFDASTSFAGEWEVDETLNDLENQGIETAIVVAIENGGIHRTNEYSPFYSSQYGGGEGDEYLDFIINILKPKIDSTFRTKKGPEDTGIMGSSMGGLISHYAHFRNPEIFGKSGVFSPAFWFSEEYFSHTRGAGKTENTRVYMLAGSLEPNFAASARKMADILLDLGFTDNEFKLVIEDDGQHTEWFWAREFRDAFLWLFDSKVK